MIELQYYMEFSKRCFYDMNSGNYQIKIKYNSDPKDMVDGSFVIHDNNLYALAKTSDGPVFIYNDKLFVLKNINYKFYHYQNDKNSSEGLCRFTFMVDNETIIDIVYEKPDEDWSSWEMDMDFFHWLVDFSHSPELIERWSI